MAQFTKHSHEAHGSEHQQRRLCESQQNQHKKRERERSSTGLFFPAVVLPRVLQIGRAHECAVVSKSLSDGGERPPRLVRSVNLEMLHVTAANDRCEGQKIDK